MPEFPAWLFFFFAQLFLFLNPAPLPDWRSLKKEKFFSRVCTYARFVEINNSLELFFFFYRNTLVFLFIKRKVSEEMPFSSEVFRIYWHNFRNNGNNFRRNKNNFGSYCYKWGRNFGSKMLKNGLFQGVKNTLIFRVFAIKNQKGNLFP